MANSPRGGLPPLIIPVEGDLPGARRAGGRVGDRFGDELNDRLGKKIRGGSRKAFAGISDELREVNQELRKVGHFGDGIDKVTQSAEKLAGTAHELRDDLAGAGDASERLKTKLKGLDNGAERLKEGIEAVAIRTKTFKKSLSAQGLDTGAFAVLDHEFKELIRLQKVVEKNFDGIGDSPELAADLKHRVALVIQALGRETAVIKDQSKTQRDIRDNAALGERQDKRIHSQRELADIRANSVRVNAITQQDTTLRNAEIRTQAQVAIASSQRTARVRIELMKFTFRRFQQIERSIAAVFKGTAAVAAGAFARVERTIFRIGGVFKRGNRDLNRGLRPALAKREGNINRSFRRQEASVRGSVHRQSATIRRFETQASTGIAGALTGRSSLGALFGGGLAFGGGFALFRKLGDSIQVGGDFVQGLAVLQEQLQLTEAQMAGVREQSIVLGNDISLPGVSALDAAQAIAALTKQFGALGDAALPAAQAAAKGVLQLSRATNASAEDAAALVGAATNIFGISADDAVSTADKITAALTRAAGVGITQFTDSFKKAAAVFALFQKPALGAEGALVGLNTAIAVLARGGITGSEAGTGLKQFFIQSVKSADSFVALRKQITESAGHDGSIFFNETGDARKLSDAIHILRRGLRDYSDEAKATALTKLFGARASTIASILINTSKESFDALEEAQLREGAAAAIAAAQNVGLRGALDALQSQIETQQIKTYEKFQGVAAKVVLRMAELFQVFFEGTGKIAVFKTAITGLTVALGGLLILKGSFELFKFFGISLGALVSPIGFVIGAVAALGVAIALLLKSSTDFRTSIGNIGSSLASAIVPILEFAGDLLAKFVNLLNDKVVPSIVRFSVALAEGLETQVGRFIRFLETEAIPALVRFKDAFVEIAGPVLRKVFDFIGAVVNPIIERLGQLITSVAVPAFHKLADVLSDRVDPALDKIREVGGAIQREVEPLIRPAIDAFRELGEVIGVIAGKRVDGGLGNSDLGDLSTLGPAFRDLLTGLLDSFANIGERIIEVVGPQIPKVFDFLISQFSEDRVLAIAAQFGRLAEGIGRVIGQIAGSPEFLGALAAIIATAGFVAVKFLEGLAKGLVIGLPRTFSILKDELGPSFEKLLKSIFNPVKIGKAIIGGFVVAGLASALFRTLRGPIGLAGVQAGTQAGQRSGLAFVRHLGLSMAGAVTGSRSRNLFATGLFGGNDAFARATAKEADRAGQAALRKQKFYAQRLRALGIKSPPLVTAGGVANPAVLKRLNEVETGLSRAGVAGVNLRTNLGNVFKDIRGIARASVSGKGYGILDRFRAIRAGSGQLRRDVGATFRGLARDLKVIGAGLGQAIGGALLAGIGGVLSGQQLGGADNATQAGLGLAGLFASALFGGAAVGGGVQGAIVGGTILAVGTLAAVMEKSGKAAKEAAERIDLYKQAILDAKTAIGTVGDLGRAVADQFKGLDQGSRDLLTEAGFDARRFSELVLDGVDGIAALRGASINPEKLFGDGQAGLRLAVRAREVSDAVADAADELAFLNTILPPKPFKFFEDQGVPKVEPGFIGPQLDEIDRGLRNVLEHAQVLPPTIQNIDDAIESLNLQRTQKLQAEISDVTAALDVAKDRVQDAKDALFGFFGADYAGTVGATVNSVVGAVTGISGSIASALGDGANAGSTIATAAFEDLVQGFDTQILGIGQGLLAEFGEDLKLEQIVEKLVPIREAIAEALKDTKIGINADENLSATEKSNLIKRADEAAGVLVGRIAEFEKNDDFDFNLAELQFAVLDAEKEQAKLDALNLKLNLEVVFDSDEIRIALRDAGIDTSLFDPDDADSRQWELNHPEGSNIDADALVAAVDAAVAAANIPQERTLSDLAVLSELAEFLNPSPTPSTTTIQIDVEATEPLPVSSEIVRALAALAASGVPGFDGLGLPRPHVPSVR